jgi:hypothetical protein
MLLLLLGREVFGKVVLFLLRNRVGGSAFFTRKKCQKNQSFACKRRFGAAFIFSPKKVELKLAVGHFCY